MKESDIQKQIMGYLAARRVFAIRMNSGAMFGSHKGKKWAVRFGAKGMADILAIPINGDAHLPVWIEVKTPKGVQSPDQKLFQALVESQHHVYILARSLDDVIEAYIV